MAKEKKNRFTRKDYDTMVTIINNVKDFYPTAEGELQALYSLKNLLVEHNFPYEAYEKFVKVYMSQVKGETPTITEISQIINIMNL